MEYPVITDLDGDEHAEMVPWTAGAETGTYRARADDSGTGVGYVVECDETNNAADWP